MPVRLFIANQVVRYRMRARFEKKGDISPLRPMMATMAADPARVPAHVRLEPTTLGGVPGERLASPTAIEDAAILYVHGGAFIAGSPKNHRALTWRLAHGTGVPVYAIDYRLAPEHPFPAALEDVVTAYRALLDRGVVRIAIAGDSAGGNLTLASALEIGKLDIVQPVALGCISAVVTLRDELPSVIENRDRDAMFPPGMMDGVVARYAPNINLGDARLSPLHAADVSKLPPTIFQCGDTETLRDHSIQMSQRMSAAGVTTQLEVTPRVFHVWHLAADMVPEAKSAIDRLVAFLRPRLRAAMS